MIDHQTKENLFKWAALVGFALGGLPTFLFSLNPPTALVIPIGPTIMLLLALYATHLFIAEPASPMGTLKKVGLGAALGGAYTLLTILIMGFMIGTEWWAWAFVIGAFAVPGGLAIGSIIGVFAGKYCERVIRGDVPPPVLGRLWNCLAGIVLLIFIGLPMLSWRLFHG